MMQAEEDNFKNLQYPYLDFWAQGRLIIPLWFVIPVSFYEKMCQNYLLPFAIIDPQI